MYAIRSYYAPHARPPRSWCSASRSFGVSTGRRRVLAWRRPRSPTATRPKEREHGPHPTRPARRLTTALALLEPAERVAEATGVPLLGYGESSDGYHMASPHPSYNFV